jgi:uncharacterized protein YwgA
MDKKHLPLLLASGIFANPNESEPLDNLRMQKGIFLLINSGNPEWRNLFSFRPYDWGPYSNELTQTVNELCAEGLLTKEPSPNSRYLQYKTTYLGDRVVFDILPTLSDADGIFIRNVRYYVNSRPFARLLREVYKAYPDYAVNSRFASLV